MYRIRALKFCEQSVPGSQVLFMRRFEDWQPFFFYVFLVQGQGRNVLVDCGMHDLPRINRALEQTHGARGHFHADPGGGIPTLLERQGVGLADIDLVILTHLHYDHCQNAPLFPRARFVLPEKGWTEFRRARERYGARLFPDPTYPADVIRFLEENAARVELVPDDRDALPGIRVYWTGGHTVENAAVAVQTTAGLATIPGDTAWTYENVELDVPPGSVHSIEQCLSAYDRLRREGGWLLPNHDPKLLQRHPGGAIG